VNILDYLGIDWENLSDFEIDKLLKIRSEGLDEQFINDFESD
jgi:hypothetical protein